MSSGSGSSGEALARAVAELAAAANDRATPDELLRGLADVAGRHLAVDGVGVMVLDEDGGGTARFVHAHPPAVAGPERLQQVLQEGPCQDAMAFQVEVVVDDLEDPVQTAWEEYVPAVLDLGFRSVVALPLVARGRVWGALDLYRREAGTWQLPELTWTRLLAQVTASYLVMAADRDEARRAERELAHHSAHDALTGLPNRVLLFDRLDRALAAARRRRESVACLFIDLDRFKAVNDTYGHAAGDTVLVTVAHRLQDALRGEDTLARLAGDEFVLLCEDLPQASPEELEHGLDGVVTRLRRALAEPVACAGTEIVVSASIGIALSGEGTTPDDLLADADGAMYRAKREGAATVGTPRRRSGRRRERSPGPVPQAAQLELPYRPAGDAAGEGRTGPRDGSGPGT